MIAEPLSRKFIIVLLASTIPVWAQANSIGQTIAQEATDSLC